MHIDWASFETSAGSDLSSHAGRAGHSNAADGLHLHYLKYQHDLSDENVRGRIGSRTPTGSTSAANATFSIKCPSDASSMTRWRQRLGEAGAEQMLRSTIETGIKNGRHRPRATEAQSMWIRPYKQRRFAFPPTRGSIIAAGSGW